jgi:hypothetical protein
MLASGKFASGRVGAGRRFGPGPIRALCLSLPFLSAAVSTHFSAGPALAQGAPVVLLSQGASWTPALRLDFYSRDQGSRMIPLTWLRALKQANGQPFLADSLARYGYLPNPANSNGLPVGFTASGPTGAQTVGMNCAACHTRQITVAGQAYRIDGGPGIVDFQSLLSDLDVAVGNVLASDAAFSPFAEAVLGASPDSEDVAALRQEVQAWYLRYHTLMAGALPKAPTPAWGPARLDAVGMIFNRVTGLDLGPPPSFLLPQNIKTADAPVRYPFLWNAPRQDLTQWSAFAQNGNDILALSRNLGEVFGVFGVFQPKNEGLVINFLNNNSANFDGLSELENLIKQIGPPKWPWAVDPTLAAQGKIVYDRPTAQGGCKECHDIQPGKVRSFEPTWATPLQNVGTDTRQYDVLAWQAKTGALQGAFIPFVIKQPLKETDTAFNILAASVVGSIAEHIVNIGGGMAVATNRIQSFPLQLGLKPAQLSGRLPPALRDLEGAFKSPDVAAEGPAAVEKPIPDGLRSAPPPPPRGAYEARVMQGIWAAAPYLHNGSVPTLAELLKPASERVPKFKVGPAYDTTNIGLAAEQTQFNYELATTDCSDRNSGNSRCGHEFGTQLPPADKKALLEYLKTL